MTLRRKLRPYRVNKAAEVLVYRHAVSLIRLQHSLLCSDHSNETFTQAVTSVTLMVAMSLTACW